MTVLILALAALLQTPEIEWSKDSKSSSIVYACDVSRAYSAAMRVAAEQGVITHSDRDAGVIAMNVGGGKQHGRQARLSISLTTLPPAEDKTPRTRVHITPQGFQLGFKGWGDKPATKKFYEALTRELHIK